MGERPGGGMLNGYSRPPVQPLSMRDALQKLAIPSIRPWQLKVVESWQAGTDCLVLSGTGSGKSLCFQLPCLLSAKPVLVISPLISLMRDQCAAMNRRGVSSCFLGSAQLDKHVERDALAGCYRLVYTCPETALRLTSQLVQLHRTVGIGLVAVDEAHCVSKWGHDFRPKYGQLSLLTSELRLHGAVAVMALTATATLRVQHDIKASLAMRPNTLLMCNGFHRPNLSFSVHHCGLTMAEAVQRWLVPMIHGAPAREVLAGSNQLLLNNMLSPAEPVVQPVAEMVQRTLDAGWLQTQRQPPTELNQLRCAEWTCPACTLLNEASSDSCAVCEGPRVVASAEAVREGGNHAAMCDTQRVDVQCPLVHVQCPLCEHSWSIPSGASADLAVSDHMKQSTCGAELPFSPPARDPIICISDDDPSNSGVAVQACREAGCRSPKIEAVLMPTFSLGGLEWSDDESDDGLLESVDAAAECVEISDDSSDDNLTEDEEIAAEIAQEIEASQAHDEWKVPCSMPYRDQMTRQNLMADSAPHEQPGGSHGNGQHGVTIAYAPTRKDVEAIAALLLSAGVRAAAYHAGLPREHLQTCHAGFMDGSLQCVVATVAFGLGINKPDVRTVVHWGWPQSIEQYFQEAGRAGRDGQPADCVLIADLTKLPSLFPSKGRSAVQTRGALESLIAMHEYAISHTRCRANSLLKHFGEQLHAGCGTCDTCTTRQQAPKCDVTVETLHLLKVVNNTQQKSSTVKGHKKWGAVAKKLEGGHPTHWWRGLARCLLKKGLLIDQGKVPTMRVVAVVEPALSAAGHALLSTNEREQIVQHMQYGRIDANKNMHNTSAHIQICVTPDMAGEAPAQSSRWFGAKRGRDSSKRKAGGRGKRVASKKSANSASNKPKKRSSKPRKGEAGGGGGKGGGSWG